MHSQQAGKSGTTPKFRPSKQQAFYATYGTRDATRPLSNINVVITNIEEPPPTAKAVDLPDESDVEITRELALRLQKEIRQMKCDTERFSKEATQKFNKAKFRNESQFFQIFVDLDYRIPWSKTKALIEGFNFLEPYLDKLCLAPLGETQTVHKLWLTVRALDDTEDIYTGPIPEVFSSLEAAVD